jgi:glycosyltransferase involved in cell wall biosynthesis
MHNLPVIDVVLCTYNGEKYLSTFLDSLVQQQNVRVRLFVSDDFSDDKTIEILNSYALEFEIFDCIINYPRLGPKRNFIETLKRTSSHLVAFADQDDVWDQWKLSKLASEFALQGITAAHSNLVTSDGRHYNLESYDLVNALWRNKIPGCTLMISRDVASILCKVNPTRIVMHDWAAIIIALAIGRISKVSQELVEYRLHDNNYFGFPSVMTRLRRFVLQIFRFETTPIILVQTEELYQVLVENGYEEDSPTFGRMLALRDRSIIHRVRFSFRYIFTFPNKRNFFVVLRVLTKSY